MALPKIKHAAYSHYLTGLGRDVKFRCFTNKEQKAMLEAKEESSKKMVYDNVKAVVQACIMDSDVDVNDMPMYDFEDIFVRIRSKSVDQYIMGTFEIPYVDDDGKEQKYTHKFSIDVDDIKIVMPDNTVSDTIQISENYLLKMKHPTIGSSAKEFKTEDDFIIEHMVCVFSEDGDEVSYFKDEPKEDIMEFYDSIESPAMIQIANFLSNQPSLHYTMEVDLPNGEKKNIVFNSLDDFFI